MDGEDSCQVVTYNMLALLKCIYYTNMREMLNQPVSTGMLLDTWT